MCNLSPEHVTVLTQKNLSEKLSKYRMVHDLTRENCVQTQC